MKSAEERITAPWCAARLLVINCRSLKQTSRHRNIRIATHFLCFDGFSIFVRGDTGVLTARAEGDGSIFPLV